MHSTRPCFEKFLLQIFTWFEGVLIGLSIELKQDRFLFYYSFFIKDTTIVLEKKKINCPNSYLTSSLSAKTNRTLMDKSIRQPQPDLVLLIIYLNIICIDLVSVISLRLLDNVTQPTLIYGIYRWRWRWWWYWCWAEPPGSSLAHHHVILFGLKVTQTAASGLSGISHCQSDLGKFIYNL